MLFADSIADLSYILEEDYDLKTSISVLAPSFPYVMPPKAVLYRLKAVLHRLDIHSISTDQPASSDMAIEAPSAVSNHHASALFDDSTLTACTMWVSDTAAKEPPLLPLEDVMTFLGVLENLTKLHLTLSEDCTAPEFEALSELSWLEDLALQCLSHASDASDVIYSSSQTLCCFTLSAASWTANTYTSLQQATQLETLNVRIKQLDLTQGHAPGGVVADKFQLSLHRSISSPVVKAMAARNCILHNLTLWNHTDTHLDWLPELPTLQSITFVNSLITGKTMKQYNEVTKLEFMNCHHVSGPGLRHMIDKAFPSLKALLFFAAEGACVKAIRLSVAAMRALPCGQNLQLIDLRGIFNLSQDRIDQLQRTFVKQQRQGKAQPIVKVLLPNQGVAAVQYVLKIKDIILAPNIFESRRFFCEHEVVLKH